MMPAQSGIPVDTILADVASITGISRADLESTRKTKEIAAARFVAMTALYHSGMTVADVGRLFGRDHSTTSNALRQAVSRPALAEEVATVLTSLQARDPLAAAMALVSFSVPQRRGVARYLTDVLLSDRPCHSVDSLLALRLLGERPAVIDALAASLVLPNLPGTPYWRTSAAAIDARIWLHVTQAGYLPRPPVLIVPSPLVVERTLLMSRIELIDPASIPTAARNNHAVTEAAEWLRKASTAGQAVVIRLKDDERATQATKVWRMAAASLRLEVLVTSGPERRTYTAKTGKETTEPAVLYVRLVKAAAPGNGATRETPVTTKQMAAVAP